MICPLATCWVDHRLRTVRFSQSEEEKQGRHKTSSSRNPIWEHFHNMTLWNKLLSIHSHESFSYQALVFWRGVMAPKSHTCLCEVSEEQKQSVKLTRGAFVNNCSIPPLFECQISPDWTQTLQMNALFFPWLSGSQGLRFTQQYCLWIVFTACCAAPKWLKHHLSSPHLSPVIWKM